MITLLIRLVQQTRFKTSLDTRLNVPIQPGRVRLLCLSQTGYSHWKSVPPGSIGATKFFSYQETSMTFETISMNVTSAEQEGGYLFDLLHEFC